MRLESGSPEVVAGRYLLERKLAKGGMGEVFAALDESTGRRVALKRALTGQSQRALVVHFMREYHALSQLRHPRIIEVYDYGVDQDAPYYTMELLDGSDLSELSPVPYREACRYLRDVASSLALLHARRILHRDVSPRNVRCTSDGRCKLLDFGAMVPFGVPAQLTGTPPCIPPEALQGASLDQRADLYALGALAYYVLTGRHAYPVRDIAALRNAWERPCVNPRRITRDLPQLLDELVMSLLHLDPLKRPSSAAEVIDWLASAGALEPDDSTAVARSFLTSSRLVAREAACATLQSRVADTVAGHGCAVLISGEAGSGRSRMLAEAARLGQTSGLTVVRAVARASHGAASTPLNDLVLGLRQAAPLETQRARRTSQTAAENGEIRVKLLAELAEFFQHVARARPLLITVDDLDRADELSGALVAAIAYHASSAPLMLVASYDCTRDAPVLANVRGLASTLELAPLDRAATRTLVESLFGDVPHLERVSDWLFRVAAGSPKLTLEVAEHLLARGSVRYLGGTWVLPSDIDEPIPPSTTAALMLRLDSVSATAKSLAELLSVSRGGASAERLLDLAREPDEQVFDALDELVRAGVLESAGHHYVFAQNVVRKALAGSLAEARRRQLHALWAEHLLAEPPGRDTLLEAGWHLIHTDQEMRGANLLAKVAPELVERRVSMAAAIPALERALEVYERRGGPLAERLRLRGLLVMSSFLFDHRLAERYATQTLDALYPFTGLSEGQRFARWFGKPAGFVLGVIWASARWLLRRPSKRGPHVAAALLYYGRAAMGLSGLRALALDAAGSREVLERVRGFEDAPHPSAAVIHALVQAIALFNEGRSGEIAGLMPQILNRLTARRPLQMSEQERVDILSGALLLAGINECYNERSRALTLAERLEGLGTPLAQAAALRIRMTYHGLRGERDRAQHYRRLLDLSAIQNGTHWQLDWIAAPLEGMSGITWSDIVVLRRTLENMERLASEVPSFAPLRDTLRIGYAFRRGDYASAVKLGEEYLATHAPYSVLAWAITYAMTALSHIELGQNDRALAICEYGMRELDKSPRAHFFHYMGLEAAYATSLALHGQRERAEAAFEAVLQRLRGAEEYTRACLLHEYRIKVARKLGDRAGLERALAEMREDALASRNPTAIALADRVAELRAAARSSPLPPGNLQVESSAVTQAHETAVTVFLRRERDPALLARHILDMLGHYVVSGEGYLFWNRKGTLQLVASMVDRPVPRGIEAILASGPANDGSYSLGTDERYRFLTLGKRGTPAEVRAVVRELDGESIEFPTALIMDIERALNSAAG